MSPLEDSLHISHTLSLCLSVGLVRPVTTTTTTSHASVLASPTSCSSSSSSSSGVCSRVAPTAGSSTRGIARSIPSTSTSSSATSRLRAALLAVAKLEAVLALDSAPVLGLGAFAAVVALSVAVAAALDPRLRTVGRVVAWLKTVEACASSSSTASTRLERLRAVGLAVSVWCQQVVHFISA